MDYLPTRIDGDASPTPTMTWGRAARGGTAVVFALLMILSPAAASVSVPVADSTATNPAAATLATGGVVNVTGAVVYADGTNASGDTVGAAQSSLGSPGVVRTTAEGAYALELSANASHEIVYAQGDVQNGTGVFPRDGSVDLYALGNVTVGTTDTDLGRASLPTGYVVDVLVNDTNGDPVEDVQVLFVHRNQTAGGTAMWGNRTSADGHVYPYQDPGSQTDPGLELAGEVQVVVFPPGTNGEPITRNLTVTSTEDVTVTLPAPPSGNLTVDDAGIAGFQSTNFSVRNVSGVDGDDFYEWSFGDGQGTFTDAPNNTTAHQYQQPGQYEATVSVYDNGTELPLFTDTVNVTVQPAATADFVVDPTTANASENVSYRVENLSLNVDTNVSYYAWDLGDGNFTSTFHPDNDTVHAYAANGTYTARVRVYSQFERTLFLGERNVTVGSGESNQPPDPYLFVNRSSVTVGDPVRFDGSDSYDPDGQVVEYRWDFDGDGAADRITQGWEVVHSYGASGTYNASLTVVDDDGATGSDVRTITVSEAGTENQPPDAVLGANRTSVRVGDPVRLDGTDSLDPDGTIVEYRWDFDGDGATDRATQDWTVVHTYGAAGTYDATLTVVDNDSATGSDTVTISVQSDVTPTTGAWPQFHYDAANSGYNASAQGPVPPVEVAWNTSDLAAEPLAPVVWNGMVISTEDPRVRAYDAATGNSEWSTSLYPSDYSFFDDGERFDLTSAPTVVNGVAYVGAFWNDSSANTTYEIVYALDATTGNELWNVTRPTPWNGFFDDGIAVAEPKVVDGKVVVTSAVSDSVFVLDAGGSHTELWSDDLQARHASQVRSPAAVANGTVFVTQGWDDSDPGYLYAFNLTTGDHLWNASLGYNYDGAAPAVAGGVVYLAHDGVSTVAFDAENGTELWSGADSYAGVDGSAAVTENLVVVGKGFTAQRSDGIPGGVRALDRDTGALVWEFNASGPVTGAPAVAGGRVYLASTNATVYGLDLSTGSEVWSYDLGMTARCDYNFTTSSCDDIPTPKPVYTAPAVADGSVYVRVGSNQVYDRSIYAITAEQASGEFSADLVASPQPAYANVTNVTLSLANTSGTAPDRYEWAFGDGTTVSTTHPDANASHVYGAPGTYTARVSAYDASGGLLATDETTVEVRQPSGVLIATPTTADVNVTNVSFRLTNVTGASPKFYSWDLDGDGQYEASTSHPENTTNYTYSRLLGATTASVDVFGDGEQFLFTATEVVDVVDRIPPVARASAPPSVRTGEAFTVDASNSTDNHRIANYTFDPDAGSAVTQPSPTTDLSFATPGNHTVNVTVTDASGNTDTTAVEVFVREAPDLTVDVAAPPTQQLDSGATATLTVHNDGTDDATGVQVRLNTSARASYYRTETASFDRTVGDLAPGESTSVTVDFTDWAEENVSGSRPRVDLLATVDPADAIAESDETNNVAENATKVGYSDVYAYVYLPYRTLPSENESLQLRFYNGGSLPSPTHDATVSFGDGSPNATVTVPALDPNEAQQVSVNHTFAEGFNIVRVNVTDDPRLRGNSDTDSTRTAAFTFRLDRFSVPDTVERGETFYVYASGRSNYAADQNATIELPDGLALTDRYPRTQNRSEDSYHTYRWEVRAVNESGAQPFTVNVTGASRNLTDEVSTTIDVIPPRVRVENSTSVAITDNGTETTSLDLRGETTYDHSLSFSAQLGPQGRTLDGLEYLFDYPNYCVEQTTSPMLAALNTDQYYRENPAPGGYDRQKVNDSVAIGVERMTTGDNAQHANGAWSMYGDDPRGDMYYTAYALFGVSSVAADSVQGSRPGVAADLSTADFNRTVFWLADNQEPDGRLANDKFYFEDDAAMTGFGLVALERAGPFNASATAAADGVRANATAYLVGAQNADGSWGNGESNAMSTALAVWGLAESGVDTPAVNAAIADGSAWLVANQNGAGAWTESRSGSWRATGTTSETTAYAVLALNATGVPASNQTISEGTTFLVATYDNSGSWGYTRASAVAIETLLTLGVEGTNPSQNVTVKLGNASNPALVTKTVTVDDGTPQATVTLSDSELATLRAARGTGPPIQVTVEAAGTGQLVVGLENDQLVNADEYEANGGA